MNTLEALKIARDALFDLRGVCGNARGSISGRFVADVARDALAATADIEQPALKQATTCARCLEHKPTPLRLHDGYVCLTCIDKAITQYEAQAAGPKPDTSQEWARLDGATAFHLIERHADNWVDAGRMMDAWCAARHELPLAAASVPST